MLTEAIGILATSQKLQIRRNRTFLVLITYEGVFLDSLKFVEDKEFP